VLYLRPVKKGAKPEWQKTKNGIAFTTTGKIFEVPVYDFYEEIFDRFVKPAVSSASTRPTNLTIFAYGQSGTGKSHVINGTMKLTAKHLFSAGNSEPSPIISVSGTEMVSNDDETDLLFKKAQDEKQNRRASVSIKTVSDELDLTKYMDEWKNKRSTEATEKNSVSSRSHGFFTVTVNTKSTITGKPIVSKLTFIDLAGNETLKGATDEIKTQGQKINNR
jgi:kinesin family protein 22